MDFESDVVVLSDVEDDTLPDVECNIVSIGQPSCAGGWKEAERSIFGYSKTSAGKTPSSQTYYKNKVESEKRAAEKTVKEHISLHTFFKPLVQKTDSIQVSAPNATSALNLETSTSGSQNHEQLHEKLLQKDLDELHQWECENTPSGPWKCRVDEVIGLLKVERRAIQQGDNFNAVEASKILAAAQGKEKKYAQALRK